jgi:hypothetical protein
MQNAGFAARRVAQRNGSLNPVGPPIASALFVKRRAAWAAARFLAAADE